MCRNPNKHFRSKLCLADGTLVSIYVCRSSLATDRAYTRWILQPREADLAYPCLLARLTEANDAFQDYFVVHDRKGFGAKNLRLEDAWLRQALALETPSESATVGSADSAKNRRGDARARNFGEARLLAIASYASR